MKSLEATLKHLKFLEELLDKVLVKAAMGGETMRQMVQDYLKNVEELPDEAMNEKEEYKNKYAGYLSQLACLDASMVKYTKPADLPKEAVLSHDGVVETFNSFWIRFESLVLSRSDIAEEDKLRRLSGAVVVADCNIIAGMELHKAIQYLKDKYQSARVIREYLSMKFSNNRMKDEDDAHGLAKLKDALTVALTVVKTCDKSQVLSDLFDVAYNRLPKGIKRDFWKWYDDEKDNNNLREYSFLRVGQDTNGITPNWSACSKTKLKPTPRNPIHTGWLDRFRWTI